MAKFVAVQALSSPRLSPDYGITVGKTRRRRDLDLNSNFVSFALSFRSEGAKVSVPVKDIASIVSVVKEQIERANYVRFSFIILADENIEWPHRFRKRGEGTKIPDCKRCNQDR